MLKKIRGKNIILFCILTLILWVLGQSVGSVIVKAIPGMSEMSSTAIPMILATGLGGAAAMVLVLWRTDRLSLFTDKGTDLGRGILYAAVLIAGIIVIMLVFGSFPTGELNTPGGIVVYVLTMLAIGASEDLTMRGVITETLLEHFGADRGGIIKAVVLSAILFGVIHLGNVAAGGSVPVVLNQVLQAALGGMVLGLLYLRTGNIWVPVITHALWDFFALLSSEGGFFISGTSFAGTLNGSIGADVIPTNIMLVALAVLFFLDKGLEPAVQRCFGPYCEKMHSETAE